MQSIFVLLDIAKFPSFWRKNTDVSRTQGVCQGVHIYFSDLLKVRYNYAKSHHCNISLADFREEGSSPSVSSHEKTHPD